MRFRKLTLENFGPYYGKQEFEFARDRGVWIVYGDNGRGKTTLLNAFRYALYGTILGRRTERNPHELANSRHAAEVSRREFKTILDFEHDGAEHRITRHFRAGHDPEHMLVAERNQVPLSDSEARDLMVSVAPESISQFFLFDGELLRQYEDLRDPTVDSGRKMRDEVDRLLGVHAIENTITDLREISSAINKEKAKVLTANTKAQNLAVAMQEASDKRDALVESLADQRSKEREHGRRLGELEEILAQHDRARDVLAQIDHLRATRTRLQMKLVEAQAALQELTEDAWKAVLLPVVDERLLSLRQRLQEFDERRVEAIVARRTAQHLERNSTCPVCDTALDDSRRAAVSRRAHDTGSADEVTKLEQAVADLRAQVGTLEEVKSTADGPLLAERELAVGRVLLDLEEVRVDIVEQEDQLADIDEADVRRRQRERDDVMSLLTAVQRDVVLTQEDVQEQDNVISRFKEELNRLDVKTDPVLDLRDTVSTQMLELFSQVLVQYQDELLARVEEQASKLFMEIRAEHEYARLKIREGYGLSIVDDAGEEVTGHSAGYEHLVALSLIAALQQSSPVQGPIVMDSPFGRLDEVHTRNVVAALPQIADQVILLAFEGEFDRESAVVALGDSLVAEYRLERTSSRHTEIVRRTGS